MRSFIFSACLLSFNTFFISLQRMQCPLKSLKKNKTKQNKTNQKHILYLHFVRGQKPLLYF